MRVAEGGEISAPGGGRARGCFSDAIEITSVPHRRRGDRAQNVERRRVADADDFRVGRQHEVHGKRRGRERHERVSLIAARAFDRAREWFASELRDGVDCGSGRACRFAFVWFTHEDDKWKRADEERGDERVSLEPWCAEGPQQTRRAKRERNRSGREESTFAVREEHPTDADDCEYDRACAHRCVASRCKSETEYAERR